MELGVFPLVLVLLMLGTAVWLWRRSQTLWQQSGLPVGEVIYSDTGAWFPNMQPLFAPNFGLSGKPDYLVQQDDGSIVPVELKSGRAPDEPWEGHILQVAAYCLLVSETYGVRPAFGILQYKNKAFAIDYSDSLEEDLLDLLAEMRESQFEGELDRDHNEWQRCNGCSVRRHCYQRLA
jgi:CRISPR-associated exonuclease Cas4